MSESHQKDNRPINYPVDQLSADEPLGELEPVASLPFDRATTFLNFSSKLSSSSNVDLAFTLHYHINIIKVSCENCFIVYQISVFVYRVILTRSSRFWNYFLSLYHI